MQLEDPSFDFKPRHDSRQRVPEPLPVKLIAVKDVRLNAPAGVERQLDAFYAGLLGMRRIPGEAIVYEAENFDLYIGVHEPPIARDDFRPLRLEVTSLEAAEGKLVEAEIEYVFRRGLLPAEEALVLQDPAGNWVELTAPRSIG